MGHIKIDLHVHAFKAFSRGDQNTIRYHKSSGVSGLPVGPFETTTGFDTVSLPFIFADISACSLTRHLKIKAKIPQPSICRSKNVQCVPG